MQARKWGLFIVNGGFLVRYSSLTAKQPSVGNLFSWLLPGDGLTLFFRSKLVAGYRL